MTHADGTFLAARFRASPLFALVAHDDLAPEQREAFAALVGRGDYFGLLLPDTALPLSAKTVGRDTAGLLQALQQPGPLPAPLRESATPAEQKALQQLVIDGILEIESERGFVSGPRAGVGLPSGPALRTEHESRPTGVLQRLSLQALHCAAATPGQAPLALASRLYRHHTAPLTPDWQQRWAGVADARTQLGLDAGSSLGGLLFEHYAEVDHPAWHIWQRADRAEGRTVPAALPFKLYISLHPESLASATRVAVEVLVRAEVPAFKLIRGGLGLLRPDKLIAYLENEAQLRHTATLLAQAPRGCRAQGVPFSCAIDRAIGRAFDPAIDRAIDPAGDDGLLSWGSDPPDGHRQLDWQRIESWRSWITRRLAFALVQAQASGEPPAACCRFALERLQLEHIDTHTWSPSPDTWREE